MDNFNDLKDTYFALLKFGNKENLESLQKGNLYMKNVLYYKTLEAKQGLKGKGDINETACIINDVDIIMTDNDTNKKIVLRGKSPKVKMESKDDFAKPIFCLSSIDLNNLKDIKRESDCIKGKLSFTDEQKNRIPKELGDMVLIISAKAFDDIIKKIFYIRGLEYKFKKVRYSDFSTNYYDRIESLMENDYNNFFWKDIEYSYQVESRIVILNKNVEDNYQIYIGDMSNYSTLIPSEQLLSGNYELILK